MDKDRAKADDSYHSVTFDLQAVLTSPFAGDAHIYCKRKLSVYNFKSTITAKPMVIVTYGMKLKGQGCK